MQALLTSPSELYCQANVISLMQRSYIYCLIILFSRQTTYLIRLMVEISTLALCIQNIQRVWEW